MWNSVLLSCLCLVCSAHVVVAFVTPNTFYFNQGNQFNARIQPCRATLEENNSVPSTPSNSQGIRLNKVFKATHSRREADTLIASGRVTINGSPVIEKGGSYVIPFVDVIRLDGKIVLGWEAMNACQSPSLKESNKNSHERRSTANFEYIKYWKPLGITCTTDQLIASNIIRSVRRNGYRPKHRVYPVGRIDRDSSGLILITSDGRLPNASLRSQEKKQKIYEVFVDRRMEDSDMEHLSNGVVITTQVNREGKRSRSVTAPTKPCIVEPIAGGFGIRMTLIEGRNRQIRKMLDTLGYGVVELHRVDFMGISLDRLNRPGDWDYLNKSEMLLVNQVIQAAQHP